VTATALQVQRRPWLHVPWKGRLVPKLAVGFLVAIILVAVLAPLIAPYDPNAVDLDHVYAGPSAAHLLGTDASGRDLLSRLMWGARSALLGPLVVVVIATLAGSLIALVAVWRGGVIDLALTAMLNVVFVFPAVLLAVFAAAIVGAGLGAAVVAIAIAYIPYVARLVRAEALRQRAMPYIEACETHAMGGVRIAARHILPNILPLVIAQATVSFGYAMIDLLGISYLGFGVQPPTADWGLMVSDGSQGLVNGHYAEAMVACAVIVATIVSITIVGDYLTDRGTE
jgi:peptide/nickel transport system permease protein